MSDESFATSQNYGDKTSVLCGNCHNSVSTSLTPFETLVDLVSYAKVCWKVWLKSPKVHGRLLGRLPGKWGLLGCRPFFPALLPAVCQAPFWGSGFSPVLQQAAPIPSLHTSKSLAVLGVFSGRPWLYLGSLRGSQGTFWENWGNLPRITRMQHLSGPDGSRHSSDNSRRTHIPKIRIIVRNLCLGVFVLPKALFRDVEFLCFYSLWIFVPPAEKLPSLPGTEIQIFCPLWP